MGIGASVFLIAVGAILAFAVHTSVQGLDIAVVGYILMVAGVIGLAFTVYLFSSQRSRTSGGVVEERRVYDDRNI